MAKSPPKSGSGGSFIVACILIFCLFHFHILSGFSGLSSLTGPGSYNSHYHTNLSGTLNCHQLERLWVQAGGAHVEDPRLMASIAMAESAGNQYAYLHDSDGTDDNGYWAINTSNGDFPPGFWPGGGAMSSDDPIINARAAVYIAIHTGLGAWVTYNRGMNNGLCGE